MDEQELAKLNEMHRQIRENCETYRKVGCCGENVYKNLLEKIYDKTIKPEDLLIIAASECQDNETCSASTK